MKNAKQAGLKLAIASASKCPLILQRLGLFAQFDAIVDPQSLHHGKPDPEIYRAAQELLKLQADEVISFEDAPVGIAAIKAAGQFAVGIGRLRHWRRPIIWLAIQPSLIIIKLSRRLSGIMRGNQRRHAKLIRILIGQKSCAEK